jgi:hypothetical protein
VHQHNQQQRISILIFLEGLVLDDLKTAAVFIEEKPQTEVENKS